MTVRIAPLTGIAAALALAACGGAAASGTNGSTGTAAPISVRQLSGVGSVLVDASGDALYTPDQEANGMILCTGPCNAFWKPLTVTAGTPSGPANAGNLGVTTRPDGTTQVTANGRPLYTFVDDSAGKATGDGFTDDFNGQHFVWHVVHSAGAPGGSGAAGGTGSSSSSSSSTDNGYSF